MFSYGRVLIVEWVLALTNWDITYGVQKSKIFWVFYMEIWSFLISYKISHQNLTGGFSFKKWPQWLKYLSFWKQRHKHFWLNWILIIFKNLHHNKEKILISISNEAFMEFFKIFAIIKTFLDTFEVQSLFD